LSKVLARENKVRIKFKTKTMSESMVAVAGLDWPVMSADERNLRMQWIGRMMKWLYGQKWISDNPATALMGESVENKSERRITALGRRPRQAFTDDELGLIFSAPWFISGKGVTGCIALLGDRTLLCPCRLEEADVCIVPLHADVQMLRT
jgi:hypothetical protein